MKIKNITGGGRGLGVGPMPGVDGNVTIEWAAGETKDVDPAIIAKAKKDPANAALLATDLVVVNDAAPAEEPELETKAAKK